MVNLVVLEAPSESVLLHESRTVAYVNTTTLGDGSLFITESCVCWINENGQGFSLRYPEISLHAVSRDVSSFPRPCLYVMVDAKLNAFGKERSASGGVGDDVNGGDDEDDDDEGDSITEVRFVPENSASLDLMYQAMSDGNILHPDEDDSFSDDDESDENEESEHTGDATAARGECMDDGSEGQFENAEDDPGTDKMT